MTRHPDKSRENRVRLMARRQELVLMKSRSRDPLAADYGRYELKDPAEAEDWPAVYGDGYTATLSEAEAWLESGAWARRRARVAEPARETGAMVTGGNPHVLPFRARNEARSEAGSHARRPEARPGARP